MNDTPLDRLRRWLDPEWPAFLACSLLVPLAALASGDRARAEFFLGIAVYASTLKWLGWACLTRRTEEKAAGLRWPMELLAGLALTGGWFYVRNALGALWPASYSLIELRVLPWILLAAHLIGARRGGGLREPLRRAVTWAPFFLAVAIMLWDIAVRLEPPSTDPTLHAFIARIYARDGMFLRGFNGDNPIVYRSGFGALNAAALSISGLNAVQVVNFQHPFWLAIAAWAVSCRCMAALRRPLPALHLLPLAFLALFPIHNLPPSALPGVYYYGTARQLAPALLTGLLLLPSAYPAVGPGLRIATPWVSSLLGALGVALNAACAPFAAIALAVAGTLNLRAAGAGGIRRGLLHHGIALAACATLVFGCDRFYSRFIRQGFPMGVQLEASVRDEPGFRWEAGLARLSSESLFGFARPLTATEMSSQDGAPVTLAAFLAAGLILAWLALRRGGLPPGPRNLARLAVSGSVLWLALKVPVAFLAGGLSPEGFHTMLLGRYIVFLQLRLELLLILGVGLSSALFVVATLRHLAGRRAIVPAILGLVLLATMLAPEETARLAAPLSNGLVVRCTPQMGRVTPDDLELTAWIDQNLPPGKGRIGLICRPHPRDPRFPAELIYPVGGAQAVPLYGRWLNFCFFTPDPALSSAYDEYLLHVRDELNVSWCLSKDIRYFYISRDALEDNPGPARAIREGRLTPFKGVGASTVYSVSEP